MINLETIKQYSMSFLLKPYRWGGDDFSGLDCSALVQEILMAAGIDPDGDQTAQGLFNHFSSPKYGAASAPQLGAISFYGKSTSQITHVGWCLDNHLMIEAAGGGSSTRTVQDAIDQNAFVKIRPINRRKDLVAVLMPRYN